MKLAERLFNCQIMGLPPSEGDMGARPQLTQRFL